MLCMHENERLWELSISVGLPDPNWALWFLCGKHCFWCSVIWKVGYRAEYSSNRALESSLQSGWDQHCARVVFHLLLILLLRHRCHGYIHLKDQEAKRQKSITWGQADAVGGLQSDCARRLASICKFVSDRGRSPRASALAMSFVSPHTASSLLPSFVFSQLQGHYHEVHKKIHSSQSLPCFQVTGLLATWNSLNLPFPT